MVNNSIMVFSPARSGSTVLSLILGAHSKITNFGESHWLAKDTVSRQKSDPTIVCRAHGEDCEVLRKIPLHESEYSNHFSVLSGICETEYLLTTNKTMGHYSYMDTGLLSNFTILLYKPFEVWAGSYLSGNRKRLPGNKKEAINVLANRYFKYFRMHEEFLIGKDFTKLLVVEYLRLVTEKSEYVRHICDFLEIEFEEGMMEFNTYLESGQKDNHPIGGNVRTYGNLNKGKDGRYDQDENNIYLEKKYLDYLNEEELAGIRLWDRNRSLQESLEIKLCAKDFE